MPRFKDKIVGWKPTIDVPASNIVEEIFNFLWYNRLPVCVELRSDDDEEIYKIANSLSVALRRRFIRRGLKNVYVRYRTSNNLVYIWTEYKQPRKPTLPKP